MFKWLVGAGTLTLGLVLTACWLQIRINQLNRKVGQSLTGADPALTERSLSLEKKRRFSFWLALGVAAITAIVFVVMTLHDQHFF